MESTAPQFKVAIQVSNDAMSGNEKVCELYFTDAIYNAVNYWTGQEESMLADVISQVNAIKPTKIVQYIDSWGGSADVGFGIYNYLKGHNAKVESKILNSCASIASVMAMAGNKGKITMPRNGMMVIHQAMSSAQGNASDLRTAAAVCDKYTEQILDVYVQNNRKGKTRDEIYDLIKDGDYWMTGTEAKAMGFVDDCYNDAAITITNSIAAARKVYNNIPQRILNMASEETPATPDTLNIFTRFINEIKMEVGTIVAAFEAALPTAAVTNATGTTLDLGAALAEPITAMLNSVNASIKEQIATAQTAATASVKEVMDATVAQYKGVIDGLTAQVGTLTTTLGTVTASADAQKEVIATQNTTITKLTADLTNIMGRPAAAAGGGEGEATGQVPRKGLSAGMKRCNVQ